MFTGIVEDIGLIRKVDQKGANRTFRVETRLEEIGIDDSVACNGICLTVEAIHNDLLTFTAVHETLVKTNAAQWQEGDHINLERTLRMNGRLDGHLVQGHIDGTGICAGIRSANGSFEITFLYDKKFSALLIEKGSICVNGVSLTAFEVQEDTFKVAIIPFTWEHTNFQFMQENQAVNLEFDMVGKYIQRYISLQANTPA